jgi:hypothetical protein
VPLSVQVAVTVAVSIDVRRGDEHALRENTQVTSLTRHS